MSAPEPFELELEITGRDGRYRVAGRSSVGGECAAELLLDSSSDALRAQLGVLEYALLASSATTRRRPDRHETPVRALGDRLFRALFTDDLRLLLETTRQTAAAQSAQMRLVLRVRPPELSALPWEFLYDSRRDDYLALSMPLVRYPDALEPIRPLRVRPPLRILSMSALPRDVAALDVQSERRHLADSLGGLTRTGRALVHWVPGGTWRHLVTELRSADWHVLHLVGHGEFDGRSGGGVLHLTTEDGAGHPVSATDLSRIVNLCPSLRLVVLNSCESGRGAADDPFSSTGATMIRHGLPAVLAMQYEITDHAAVEFTRAFYEALALGRPVDVAVRDARVAVRIGHRGSYEWGTPVLMLRQRDGRLFDLAPPASPPPIPLPPPSTPAPRPASTPPTPAARPASTPPGPAARPAPARSSGAVAAGAVAAGTPLAPSATPPSTSASGPAPASTSRRYGRAGVPGGSLGWRRALLAGLLPALAGLYGIVQLAGDAAGERSLDVAANAAWTSTGVELRRGQRFALDASGAVGPEDGRTAGPDGLPGDLGMRRLTEAGYAQLIARIGGGAAFPAGGSYDGVATGDGELHLSVNDLDLTDNTGSFRVRIAY